MAERRVYPAQATVKERISDFCSSPTSGHPRTLGRVSIELSRPRFAPPLLPGRLRKTSKLVRTASNLLSALTFRGVSSSVLRRHKKDAGGG
jgi:hypothetical protein